MIIWALHLPIRALAQGLTPPNESSGNLDFVVKPRDGFRGCPGTFASLAAERLQNPKALDRPRNYLGEFQGCRGPFKGACQTPALAILIVASCACGLAKDAYS